MIDVLSIYEDVIKDAIVADQNGDLTIAMFNRLSRRAELRLIDWLSGDPAAQQPPEPWLSQKNKDYLSLFITQKKDVVKDAKINWPSDYYRFEDLYRIGLVMQSQCEDDDELEDEKPPVSDDKTTPITILDSSAFNERLRTFIKADMPTMEYPIGKFVGKEIEVYPKDLGNVCLEYIRYPKFASISKEIDPEYNVPVAKKVDDYEWDEWAREPLIWFITDLFANRTSNNNLKEMNTITKKTVRE